MDRATFNNSVIEATFARIRSLSDRKGNDYSGSGDVLRSFKRNAEYLGTTPRQVWGVLVLKHWDALMTYVATGKLESEGIDQRLDDLIVYLLLFMAMEADTRRADHIAAIDGTDD